MGEFLRRLKKPSRRHRDHLRVYGDWVRVAIVPNQIVAGLLEGALQERGILFIEKKLTLDYPTNPGGQRAILVPADREQEARAMLDKIWDLSGDQ